MDEVKNDDFHFICETCLLESDQEYVGTDSSASSENTTGLKHTSGTKSDIPSTSYPDIPSTSNPDISSTSNPFVFCKLNNKIQLCQGCRQKFAKPIQAPRDIVLRHRDYGTFFNQKTKSEQVTFGNKYYHVSAHCLMTKCPRFTVNDLVIPPDFELSAEHFDYFKSNGVDISPVISKEMIIHIN